VALLVVAGAPFVARAQEPGDDEVEARLRFIEARLGREATQARWYEAGWGVVYAGGAGYGAHQIRHAGDGAALAEGIVTVTKSVIGAATMAINPLKTARGTAELDRDAALAGRDRRLLLAEGLLERNAREAEIPFKWQAHVWSALLNLAGGAVVWIAGDVRRAAQSAGLALAFGELSIWTRPWSARRDLREYKQRFGGLAGDAPLAARPSLQARVNGFALTF
jgi:hypothetical protein